MADYALRKMALIDADFQTLSDIERMMAPEEYGSAESWRDYYADYNPNLINETWIIEDGDQPVASFQFHETPAAHVAGKVRMWLMVPEDVSAELCDFLVTSLLEKMAHFPINRVIGPINTAYPTLIAALTEHGFQCIMKGVDTTLDVTAFDPAPFAAEEQRLANEGIRIFSLPQLMESDPEWEQNLYTVQAIVRRDHPRPEGILATTIPIEEWRKLTFGSTMRPTLWMIAVAANGAYVGVSNLHVEDAAGKVAHNGLTGVLRAYRRRGVARAIKVNLIKAARREGIEKIHTGNEENNPMLQLNLQLGFQIRSGFSWQQWEKRW